MTACHIIEIFPMPGGLARNPENHRKTGLNLFRVEEDIITYFSGKKTGMYIPRSFATIDREQIIRFIPEHFNKETKGTIRFRIEITGIQGKWKLNQNHPVKRRKRVIEAGGPLCFRSNRPPDGRHPQTGLSVAPFSRKGGYP